MCSTPVLKPAPHLSFWQLPGSYLRAAYALFLSKMTLHSIYQLQAKCFATSAVSRLSTSPTIIASARCPTSPVSILSRGPPPHIIPSSRHAYVRANSASASTQRFHAIYRTMNLMSLASLSHHRNCQITSTSTQDGTAASPLLAAMPREAS
jgi:hypothetical protein